VKGMRVLSPVIVIDSSALMRNALSWTET
jgi:hypothetical protein